MSEEQLISTLAEFLAALEPDDWVMSRRAEISYPWIKNRDAQYALWALQAAYAEYQRCT